MARTATDILKEAILLERRGKAFYSNVAEKSDSESASARFQRRPCALAPLGRTRGTCRERSAGPVRLAKDSLLKARS